MLTAAAAATLGLLAVLVLALALGDAVPEPAVPGLPDAGLVTGWGVPLARLLVRVAALGTIGTLLFAAVLSAAPGGRLSGAAQRAVHACSWWALAWALSSTAGAVLSVSSLYGVPLNALTPGSVVALGTEVAAVRAAVLVAGLALVVAMAARWSPGRRSAAGLLLVGLAAVVLPVVLAGHSAAAEQHALAVGSLSVHVVAATLWVGGLLVLLGYGRRPADRRQAVERFSAVALACFVATGASGVLNAWVALAGVAGAVGLGGVLGSGYGLLLVAKTTALVLLGGAGWWHRRFTLPRLRAGHPRAFARFAALEGGVLLAAVALAVALAASPPPASTPAATAPPAAPTTTDPAPVTTPDGSLAGTEEMSGHDHGELSVGVLVDDDRFHVSAPVLPGQRVTVYNSSTTEVTITADDGSFDAVVGGQTFITFEAPEATGEYHFSSRHSPGFGDVLVVR